jgi:hypothetical protein
VCLSHGSRLNDFSATVIVLLDFFPLQSNGQYFSLWRPVLLLLLGL